MAATAPAGYKLVSWNGVSNSPTQSVVVPSGGAGVCAASGRSPRVHD